MAGDPAPAAAFVRACRRERIPDEHRQALWRVHLGWVRTGSESERIRGVMDDYRHWRLFERSRLGDVESSELFERHWRAAARAFLGRGLSAPQVDEFTSAFFERVYDRLQRFSWERPFTAYLRVMLLNLARDELRRVRRAYDRERSLDDLEAEGLYPVATDRGAEETLLAREREERVQRALEELQPTDRHILLECLVDGQPGKEVAARLGIRPDALYQRLNRAKQRLRRHLAQALSGS